MPHCWWEGDVSICFVLDFWNDPYLNQQFPQRSIEAHQISRLTRNDIRVFLTHILSRGFHRWLHRFPRGVHQQFSEPFKDFLYLLRLRSGQVVRAKWDADVADAAGDFAVGLGQVSERCVEWGRVGVHLPGA